MMKALIAALALVTLMASPAFARPAAARPAAQAYTPGTFIFPTDQQLCRSGQTDFCHWRGYPPLQWYNGAQSITSPFNFKCAPPAPSHPKILVIGGPPPPDTRTASPPHHAPLLYLSDYLT